MVYPSTAKLYDGAGSAREKLRLERAKPLWKASEENHNEVHQSLRFMVIHAAMTIASAVREFVDDQVRAFRDRLRKVDVAREVV